MSRPVTGYKPHDIRESLAKAQADKAKARAAQALIEMFRREWGEIVTVGIGDSWNDAPLLSVTDLALQVQRPGGTGRTCR